MVGPLPNLPTDVRRARWSPRRFLAAMLLLSAAALGLLAAAPAGDDSANSRPLFHVQRAHYLMGTIFSIEAYHPDAARAEAAIASAFQQIRRADELMSHYREGSELSLLNRQAAHGPVRVQQELFALLQLSQRYNRETAGAFDIAANSLTLAWQQAEQRGQPLDAHEASRALELLGGERLRLDAKQRTVQFDRVGVRIDLGGIAKGWAVDRAAALLRARGVRSALISAGTSTLYAIGAPPGAAAWTIGVRTGSGSAGDDSADSADELAGAVALRDMSLSTSASSERFFTIGGRRYSHVLDPRSGGPAAGLLSATVVARSAAESDALSTAVFVLGLQDGSALLRRKSLGGLLVEKSTSTPRPAVVAIPFHSTGASITTIGMRSAS